MEKINLLSISLDKNIAWQQYSDVQSRQKDYAQSFKTYAVIILTTQKDKGRKTKYGNVTVYPTNSANKWFSLVDAVKLGIKLHHEHKFNLISAQDPIATGLVGIVLKKLLKIPLNIQLHTQFMLSPWWRKKRWQNRFLPPLIVWELHQADSLRVDNLAKAKKLKRRYPRLTATRFIQAPMRVDLAYFWKPVKKRKKITKLVSVGRIAQEKNFPLLLWAVKKVLERHPQVKLTVVGGEETKGDEERLKNLARDLGIRQSVKFTGSLPKTKVRQHLHQADVFVLSSNYEGWGLVFIEAFAAGLPVVATEVGSVGELLIPNKNSLIAPVGDGNALANKIKYLVENPQIAYRLAKFGQQMVRKRYDPSTLVKAWVDGLYQTVRRNES